MIRAGAWIAAGKPVDVPFLIQRDVTNNYKRFSGISGLADFRRWAVMFMRGQVRALIEDNKFRFQPMQNAFAELFEIDTEDGPIYIVVERDEQDFTVLIGAVALIVR